LRSTSIDGRLDERLEHAVALGGHRRERRDVGAEAELSDRAPPRLRMSVEVALVVLHDDRHVLGLVPELVRRFSRMLCSDSRFSCTPAALAVDDEHHRVGALQHVLAHLAVLRLPRHREALDADLEAADLAEVDRQEVEQQRRVLFGVDRHQLDLVARAQDAVHLLQARRLAADADPVVHQLGVDRALGDVDEAHRLRSGSGADERSASSPCIGHGEGRP
jgi:hypothetical protein